MKLILGVTTFNRLDYLRECLESFESHKGIHDWTVIVADDGSTDGTLEYLKTTNYKTISNGRRGVGHQTNFLLQEIYTLDYDVCFMVDDDITFCKTGWSDLYVNLIQQTGFDHLVYCHHDRCRIAMKSRNKNAYKKQHHLYDLSSSTDSINVLGCLYTITPRIQETVGYFNIVDYGPHESGHVDFTRRCCRAGFNEIDNVWDIKNSNEFIKIKQGSGYVPSLEESAKPSRTISDPYVNEKRFCEISDRKIFQPPQFSKSSIRKPKLSVILSTYNSENLSLMFAGFAQQTFKDFELIIVNDGGNQVDLLSYMRLYSDRINLKYVNLKPKSKEFRLSLARNRGVKAATGERIVTTDDDCIPHYHMLQHHSEATNTLIGLRRRIDPNIKSINTIESMSYVEDERMEIWSTDVDLKPENMSALSWGCNISFDREAVLKAGNYDTRFKGWGWEDCELALRVSNVGEQTNINWNCLVYHLEHPTRFDSNDLQQQANKERYLRNRKNFLRQKSDLVI